MAVFTNQATLTYNGNVINSNIATGEIIEVLSATKTAVTDIYGQNDTVTYVINIVNSGSLPFSGLSVTDDLGAYTFNTGEVVPLEYVAGSVKYYINGILQPQPSVSAGPPLVINGINVPAGGNATVIYAADTNGYAPLAEGGTIVNSALIDGGGITEITVSETITAENEASLTITKSISPSTVTENGEVTYTFVIENTGNTPVAATDNAVITDVFDPVLSSLAAAFNGTAWTEGTNYTYDGTTGIFTTASGQITVPAATFTQDASTGIWIVTPGVSTLAVTGTI